MKRVFVYGTLKSGFPACGLMESSGTLVCKASTRGTLVDLGAFPGYMREGDYTVRGELWEVRGDAMPALDRYEGNGHLYNRVKIDVTTEEGIVQGVDVYEWASGIDENQVIESGEWANRYFF